MTDFESVCREDEIPANRGLRVRVGDRYVALFRTDEGVHAVHDCCPHQGAPLSEGHFDDGTVVCPWHAWMFNVRTGKNDLFDLALPRFEVRIEDGHVLVSRDPLPVSD